MSYLKPKPETIPEYYKGYVNLLSDSSDLFQNLETSNIYTQEVIYCVPEEKHEYSYAAGKWTIKEILQHLIDTERIFTARALRIARGDKTPIAGFDENNYAASSYANQRNLYDILNEYIHLRNATIEFYRSLPKNTLDFVGIANNLEITPKAMGFINAGHELHHMNVIRERYL